MKNNTLWMPIDFINKYVSEYLTYVGRAYRLRFANFRLGSKIREARQLTQQDRKKRWIIKWHDGRYEIISKKHIAALRRQGVFKSGTTSMDLDDYALRVIIYNRAKDVAEVKYSNAKNKNGNK